MKNLFKLLSVSLVGAMIVFDCATAQDEVTKASFGVSCEGTFVAGKGRYGVIEIKLVNGSQRAIVLDTEAIRNPQVTCVYVRTSNLPQPQHRLSGRGPKFDSAKRYHLQTKKTDEIPHGHVLAPKSEYVAEVDVKSLTHQKLNVDEYDELIVELKIVRPILGFKGEAVSKDMNSVEFRIPKIRIELPKDSKPRTKP